MTATSFIDTNVLIYAASNSPLDESKRQAARTLLAQPGIGFSAQVLQEFFAVAVTKQRVQMTHAEALGVLSIVGRLSRLADIQRISAGGNRCQAALCNLLLGRRYPHRRPANGVPDFVQ
jgi:predicted nucleic acid-binding protein